MNRESKTLLLIILSIGLIWSRSSFGKISSGNFVQGLGKILVKTANNSPYQEYKSFLENIAIPNSYLFGYLVMWGEFLVACSLTFSTLYLLLKNSHPKWIVLALIAGLGGGIFLNINFWLAFSTGNSGTDNLNLLMILIQLIAAYDLLKLFSGLKNG